MSQLSHNVLIIGAGAHVPYKFPTSLEITKFIQGLATCNQQFNQTIFDSYEKGNFDGLKKPIVSNSLDYHQHKIEMCLIAKSINLFGENHPLHHSDESLFISIDKFAKNFSKAGVYSIDSYLKESKLNSGTAEEFLILQWGKLTISYIIHKYETAFAEGTREFDWIHHIINTYIKDDINNNFFDTPPSIITFNYDRFFERTIYNHLIFQKRLSPEDAKKLVDKIPIVHVYGRLGCYTNWDNDENELLKNSIINIKIIGEDRYENSPVKSTIEKMLLNCKKVYFLGYGYDKDNNSYFKDQLNSLFNKGVEIYSTNKGVGHDLLKRVHEDFEFTPTYLQVSQKSGTEVSVMKLLNELKPLTDPVENSLNHEETNPNRDLEEFYDEHN